MESERPVPLDDAESERLAKDRRLARGLRVAARRALVLARQYRREEGPKGARETACVRQALAYRAAARHLGAERPGLARTSPSRDARGSNRQTG